ncbi:MAG: DNA alkylation repair protein [Solobacterium sp.]|nr:DNA alkylation repair protein [Solobacterium sp.]
MDKILNRLHEMQDTEYRDFQCALIPERDKKEFIGIRTPQLRLYAKELMKTDRERAEAFLNELPHAYFDEDQLHAFLICRMKDFEQCVRETEHFLPYVDNWATCDQLTPAVFAKNKAALLPYIERWLADAHPYTVRFGAGMLMRHYLDDDFDERYPALVSAIRRDEYYVNMMVAWYFATALAKQYDAVIGYLEQEKLPLWTHNKTIRKAIESRRIDDEKKQYLRSLKR